MKTATVRLVSLKSEEWSELVSALGLNDAQKKNHFEFGEYATVELVINKKLQIIGGRIVPVNEY